MGYAIHWVAVEGSELEALSAALGLRLTGRQEELPESPVVGARLPSGWSLVLTNRSTVGERKLQRVSTSREVLSFFGETHVMFSTLAAWRAGDILWSVTHDASKGLGHLETEGPVPAAFGAIRETLTAELAGAGGAASRADYLFDAPIDLGRQLTGFAVEDENPGVSFEILEPAGKPPGAGFFSRLFGKRDKE